MRRNIVRRIADTKAGYWLWSTARGTALERVVKIAGETVRFGEERLVALRRANRSHDAEKRAVLAGFEAETKALKD